MGWATRYGEGLADVRRATGRGGRPVVEARRLAAAATGAILFVTVVLGAFLQAGAASADPAPVIGDLKHLCMDTHAVPSAVYSAADAAGWRNEPGMAEIFAKLSGDGTGRVWRGAGEPIRGVTAVARPLPNGVPDNWCYLLASTNFDEAVADVGDMLKLAPSNRTANQVSWEVAALDGVLRRTEDYKPKELFQPGRHGSVQTVTVVAFKGGVVVLYRELGRERIIDPPPPLPADAGDVSHFSAWIEQDGRRQPLSGEIHLQKAPFAIIFEGSHVLSYSVAASLDPTALAGKNSEEDLEAVFNPFGVGAEGERDHNLFVNPPKGDSPLAMTVHNWFDSDTGHHRFASFVIGPDGVATARREISDLFVAHGGPSIPMDHWDGRPIYLLITARPPTADHPHKDPKAAVLEFQ